MLFNDPALISENFTSFWNLKSSILEGSDPYFYEKLKELETKYLSYCSPMEGARFKSNKAYLAAMSDSFKQQQIIPE